MKKKNNKKLQIVIEPIWLGLYYTPTASLLRRYDTKQSEGEAPVICKY